MNQKLILQKVNGELSAEDFAAARETVTQQIADVEKQLNALDTEIVTVEGRASSQKHGVISSISSNLGITAPCGCVRNWLFRSIQRVCDIAQRRATLKRTNVR